MNLQLGGSKDMNPIRDYMKWLGDLQKAGAIMNNIYSPLKHWYEGVTIETLVYLSQRGIVYPNSI